MKHAHTTTFIVPDTDDGYFVAKLDNGGIRVGLLECATFDIPAGHAMYAAAASLTAGTVEQFHDERMSVYCQS